MVSDISSILFLLESEVIHFTPGVNFVSKLNLDLLFKVRQTWHWNLGTYYSDHDAIFADIALHGYQQWVPQLTRSGLKGDLYVIFRH